MDGKNAQKPRLAARLSETVFAVWCEDGPDSAAVRQRCLDGHLAYIEAHHDRYLVAGPMRAEADGPLVGSLLVVVAETEDEARAFLAGDPYFSEGAFGKISMRRLTPAAGRWMGGVIWESADALRPTATGGARRA